MTDKTNRLLLIVDPQIDFITGSLSVPGAVESMDVLAEYVVNYASKYNLICVTCDRHPLRHTSFIEFGGQWPAHCVESSVGAAVWPPLMKALEKYSALVRFLYKGQDIDKEEYSIFQSCKGAEDLDEYIKECNISDIDICGLAGDVCVANTLRDAIKLYPTIHFHILDKFTASLDGGNILSNIASAISTP
ncbi:MAG: isochorismatase family protein [Muribaculaceae bacterium]|nr:isochorismatase family protein [Muribaculaceae bacterium]